MLPPLNEATRQSSVPDVERDVEFLDTDIKSLDADSKSLGADSEFLQSACDDDPFPWLCQFYCVSHLSGRTAVRYAPELHRYPLSGRGLFVDNLSLIHI